MKGMPIAVFEVQPGAHWFLKEGKYHAWVFGGEDDGRNIPRPELEGLLRGVNQLVCRVCGSVVDAREWAEVIFVPGEQFVGHPFITHRDCIGKLPERKTV